MKQKLAEMEKSIMNMDEGYDVVLCGHASGGAQANIAALILARK